MNYRVLIFSALIVLNSCNRGDDDLANKLGGKYRRSYFPVAVYAEIDTSKKRVLMENAYLYEEIYLPKYAQKYDLYSHFLREAINGSLILSKDDLDRYVHYTIVNEGIMDHREVQFLKKSDHIEIVNGSSYSSDEMTAIICLMFDKGYGFGFDDYEGTWNFYKL